MTTYSGNYPNAGPNTSAGNTVNDMFGLEFMVTASGYYLMGMAQWLGTNGGTEVTNTSDSEIALWKVTGSAAGSYISGTALTSGAPFSSGVSGQWNTIMYPTPVALTQDQPYKIVIPMPTGNYWTDTANQWGTGQSYANGIVNGPLTIFSNGGGSKPDEYGNGNSCYIGGDGGGNPTTDNPTSSSLTYYWLDVIVGVPAPSGLLMTASI